MCKTGSGEWSLMVNSEHEHIRVITFNIPKHLLLDDHVVVAVLYSCNCNQNVGLCAMHDTFEEQVIKLYWDSLKNSVSYKTFVSSLDFDDQFLLLQQFGKTSTRVPHP